MTNPNISDIRLQSAPTQSRHIEVSGPAHRIVMDTAVPHGGTDKAANPIETLLASLIGCYNQQLRKLCVEQDIPIEETVFHVDAKYDNRAVMRDEEVDIPFPDLSIEIDIATPAPEARFDAIKARLRHRCAVSKLLLNSGCRLEERWTIRPPKGTA